MKSSYKGDGWIAPPTQTTFDPARSDPDGPLIQTITDPDGPSIHPTSKLLFHCLLHDDCSQTNFPFSTNLVPLSSTLILAHLFNQLKTHVNYSLWFSLIANKECWFWWPDLWIRCGELGKLYVKHVLDETWAPSIVDRLISRETDTNLRESSSPWKLDLGISARKEIIDYDITLISAWPHVSHTVTMPPGSFADESLSLSGALLRLDPFKSSTSTLIRTSTHVQGQLNKLWESYKYIVADAVKTKCL